MALHRCPDRPSRRPCHPCRPPSCGWRPLAGCLSVRPTASPVRVLPSRVDPARTRTVQTSGAEHGLHELARQSEIQAYFDDILHRRFVGSGHLTFLGGSEHHREGDEHHVTSLPRCRPRTTVRAHQRLRPTSVRRNRHLRRNRRARRRHRPNPQRNHRSTPRRRPDYPRPRHPGRSLIAPPSTTNAIGKMQESPHISATQNQAPPPHDPHSSKPLCVKRRFRRGSGRRG